MSRVWQDDKAWTDAYLPTIKAICGYYFIGEAPQEEDTKRNTDLIVLNIHGIRVAVRLRKYRYWIEQKNGRYRYRGEFTIRNSRPTGTLTEWQKIFAGMGDFFFYGFVDEEPPKLRGFGILDLHEFRPWAQSLYDNTGKWPGTIQQNGDGVTFRAITWASVPETSILSTWPKDIASGISLMSSDLRRAVQLALEYLA
jgi:hypothetical protein